MRTHRRHGLLGRWRAVAAAIAMGLSQGPVAAFDQVITQQSVFLTGGGGSESILVDRGRLDLAAAPTPYGYLITLDRGLLTGEGTLATPLDYVNGAALGPEAEAHDLTVEGLVSGTGSLAIINETTLLGGLSVGGNLYINNRARTVVSGPFDVAGETFIDRVNLELNGTLGDLGGRFRVTPTFITADAALVFGADATVDYIWLDPRGSSREGTFNRTRLVVGEGANLTVREPIDFFGGVVGGSLHGQQTLVKRGVTEGYFDDFANAGFQQVLVEEGALTLRGNAGDATPELRLAPGRRVTIDTDTPFRGAVQLSGRLGVAGADGLLVPEQRAFSGDLFLGQRGQLTSNGVSGGLLTSDARIHGGDLHLPGRWSLRVEGDRHTYTGDTVFGGGAVTLAVQGRLDSTRAIIGSGRPSGTGGRSRLILDNSSSVVADRIPDATPVSLGGMELRLIGQSEAEVTERLGAIRLDRGVSDVVVENPGSGARTNFRLSTLDRGGNGSVVFRGLGPDASVFLDGLPALDNGLIGPWALVGDVEFTGDSDFATYGPEGVVPYGSTNFYRSTLPGATSTDNVSLDTQNQPVVLDRDTSVNALRTRQNTLDLAGNTLSIRSGGFLARPLQRTITQNGVLTAGDGTADAELMTYGNHRIEASITDNGSGAVALTHGVSVGNNSADMILDGDNAFSGPITVNSSGRVASVTVTNPLALPAGADVILNGGHLRFDLPSDSAPLRDLGALTVRDAGRVFRLNENAPGLRLTELTFESGTIGVPVLGDTPIRKIKPGVAQFDEFENTLDQHTGPILVEEGLLAIGRIGPAPLEDAHAITVRPDGVLQSIRQSVIDSRLIRLDGGRLEGQFQTRIEVTAPGGRISGSLLVGASLVGEEDLVFEAVNSDFNADLAGYTGDLTFRGRTLRVNRDNPDYAGTVRVENSQLEFADGASIGDAAIEVTPAGTMAISQVLDANVHLAGGVVRFMETSTQGSAVLTGDLSVSEHSYVFVSPGGDGRRRIPQVRSHVRLNDGSRLVVSETPGRDPFDQEAPFAMGLQFGSTVEVAGEAVIESFETLIGFTGLMLSRIGGASLDLTGGDTFTLSSSIRLEEAGTLRVTQRGSPVEFSLVGRGRLISGDGTLQNDLELSRGAILSPGDSAGVLEVDGDVTFGDGARFFWDLEDPTRPAGEGGDLLRVHGEFNLEGDWVLQLQKPTDAPLPAFGRWLIAEAGTLTGFDPNRVTLVPEGAFAPSIDRLELVEVGDAIYLVAVPEPGAASLLVTLSLLGAAAAGGRRPTSDR